MLHLQCTKKVLKVVGKTKSEPMTYNPTLYSWHVNEFRANRRKLLLFTNDLTHYSVYCYPVLKPQFLKMNHVLATVLMESLMNVGFDMSIAREYLNGFDPFLIGPTNSRRVLGVMNDLKQQILFMMSDYNHNPLGDHEIIKRLNQTPYRIPGHDTFLPVEAFAQKLGSSIGPLDL